MRFLTLLITILLATAASAQIKTNSVWQAYIDKYSDLAIEQMHKYKIPASITLAQGLFESGAGQSTLAKVSNNHFGIKCHSDWTGKRTYHDDDRKNDCFRVYSSVKDSYEDHSKFLLRSRYARLFELDMRDYKGWARGLKACGYATLPTYANRLIDVIEAYELYKYDGGKGKHRKSKNEDDAAGAIVGAHQLVIVNSRDAVIAKEGDTWVSLSKELKKRDINVSERKLRKYNESPTRYFFPPAGTVIFLEKKGSHADKNQYTKDYRHKIQPGESLYTISQKYGIRLDKLYKLNGLSSNYQPEAGDLLRVR